MKQDVAERWVAALRSGDYEQGQGCLQSSGKYCCLGVLSHKLDPNCDSWNPSDPFLSARILELSGVKTLRGEVTMPSGMRTLAAMNDGGCTFAEIADVIEAKWPEL